MKRLKLLTIALFTTILLGDAEVKGRSVDLLPGLTYKTGSDKLGGKFVFLFNPDYMRETNSESAATIYEFDLVKETMRKVMSSPNGRLFASREGGGGCVVFSSSYNAIGTDNNVFIYSEAGLHRTLVLESSPRMTLAIGVHLFVQLEGYNHGGLPGFFVTKDPRQSMLTKILHYDGRHDSMTTVQLTGASSYQYEAYERLHRPRGQTNEVHFVYTGVGTLLEQGKDYPRGIYALNLVDKAIRWVSDEVDDSDDESFTRLAVDGRRIHFARSGDPVEGYRLMSSQWDGRVVPRTDSRKRDSRLLHTFSRFAALSGGRYSLEQLSPDGRFAFIRYSEPTSRKYGILPGWNYTYYVVNTASGATTRILDDRTQSTSRGQASVLTWVK